MAAREMRVWARQMEPGECGCVECGGDREGNVTCIAWKWFGYASWGYGGARGPFRSWREAIDCALREPDRER